MANVVLRLLLWMRSIFTYDTFVSDYVFMHCRDIVDLMRRGLWDG